MKSYKEINDDIIVSEELKEKTAYLMKNKRIHNHVKRKLAIACTLMIVLGGMAVIYRQKPTIIPQKQEEKIVFKLSEYVHNFDSDKVMTGVRTGMRDIAGGLYNMNRNLLNETIDEVPALYQLSYPHGYEVSMSFMEYRYDEGQIGPCATIQYTAEKGDHYIYAEIAEKDIPRCMAGFSEEQEGWKAYKDYSIYIAHCKREAGEFYWVRAKKKNYNIEISAVVENSKDFETFLESFLI